MLGIDKLKLKNGTIVATAVAQMGKYFRRPLALTEIVNGSEDSLHQAVSRIIVEVCEYYIKKYNVPPKDIIVYR